MKDDILLFSRSRLVRTALSIVDRDGPGALTIRRLAAAVCQPPMNIYFWFRSKDDLVDQMVDAVFAPIPDQLRHLQGSWKRKVREAFTILRSALLAHPGAFSFLHTRRASGPCAARSEEILLEIVPSGGFSDVAARRICGALTSYTIGFAFLETRARGRSTDPDDRAFRYGLDQLIPGSLGIKRAGSPPPHPAALPEPRSRSPSRLAGPGR